MGQQAHSSGYFGYSVEGVGHTGRGETGRGTGDAHVGNHGGGHGLAGERTFSAPAFAPRPRDTAPSHPGHSARPSARDSGYSARDPGHGAQSARLEVRQTARAAARASDVEAVRGLG